MTDTIISTAIQLGVILLVCAIVYFAMRDRGGFWRFIGVKGAPVQVMLIACVVGAAGSFALLSFPVVRQMVIGPGTVIAQITKAGITWQTMTALAIAAIFKTAFAEEILFRGLIAKRLYVLMGFAFGNFVQAIIFGGAHLALAFVAHPSPKVLGALCLFAALLGLVNGWLNERFAGGSILPGFAAHATANLITYLGVPLLLGTT